MKLCAVQSYSETEYDLIVYDTSVQVLTLNWTLTRFIHLWLSGCLRTMPHLFLFDWLTLTRAALYKIGTAQLIWKRPPLFGSPVLSKVSALKGLRCGRGHGCACQTRPNSTSQDCVYLLCLIWSSNCWYSTEVHWFCWYKCSPGRALRPNSAWKPDLSSRLTILLTFPHDILSFPFFHLSAGSGSALIDPSCFLLSPSPSFFLSLRKPDPISLWGSSHLQLNGARFSTQDASGLYSIHDLLEVISMILTGYIYDRHDTSMYVLVDVHWWDLGVIARLHGAPGWRKSEQYIRSYMEGIHATVIKLSLVC